MQGAYAGERGLVVNRVDNRVSATVHKSGTTKRGTTWRKVVTMLVALAWGITIFSVVHHNAGVANADTRAQSYVVHQGDTLWSIATETSGTTVDTRSVVLQIMRMNHMRNAQIFAGEKLLLPNS